MRMPVFDCERASSAAREDRAAAIDERRTRVIYSCAARCAFERSGAQRFFPEPRWQCRKPRKKSISAEFLLRKALRARAPKRAIRNLRRFQFGNCGGCF